MVFNSIFFAILFGRDYFNFSLLGDMICLCQNLKKPKSNNLNY